MLKIGEFSWLGRVTVDTLRGMLKMQLVAAERELQATQSRLNRIQARLTYLRARR